MSLAPPLRRAPSRIAVLAVLPAILLAGAARAQDKMREIPVAKLGDTVKIEERGFEMLVPEGFRLAPDSAALEQERQKALAAEFERQLKAGVIPPGEPEPRINFRKYVDDAGNVLLITVREPGLRPLASAVEFQQQMAKELIDARIAWEGVGNAQDFRSRGGRVGYVVERRTGVVPGGPLALHQVLALLRTERREAIVLFTAPIAVAAQKLPEYLASIGSMLLADPVIAIKAVDAVPPKAPPGLTSPAVLANVGILVLLVGLLVTVLRRKA